MIALTFQAERQLATEVHHQEMSKHMLEYR